MVIIVCIAPGKAGEPGAGMANQAFARIGTQEPEAGGGSGRLPGAWQ